MRLSEIAAKLNEKHYGEDVDIKSLGSLDTDYPDQILYVENSKYLKKALSRNPAAIVVPRNLYKGEISYIEHDDPRFAFIQLLKIFNPFAANDKGIHANAIVSDSAVISDSVTIMAGAVIMDNVTLEADCVIYPNCVIGRDVSIGKGTILYSGVIVMEGCTLGRDCIVHPGTVIGADGFNFYDRKGEKIKTPHIGIAKIGDRVEIGANCTIDRAVVDKTEIGDDTKLDNLVHIAHNVKIGKKCIIAAQAGISGSSVIGDNVMILGQAGIADHIEIAGNTIIMPQSGIPGNIKTPDIVFGTPARPRKEHHKIHAALKYLPDLLKRVSSLEKAISANKDKS
ncbi:MAG: UDP-3-O-(3-hydroxymyristoyl)glucosamine N-acyltransferase [Spirochaetes bacterium]|nr:UDP-3-O-(3-hydroxymyristoyl)glucosamine N-acyltransferase [Spirochaetota bacterium]